MVCEKRKGEGESEMRRDEGALEGEEAKKKKKKRSTRGGEGGENTRKWRRWMIGNERRGKERRSQREKKKD